MKRIHILGNKLGIYSRHLHPIRVFCDSLNDFGVVIECFYSTDIKAIENCDVLLFFEASYRNILPIVEKNRKSAINFLSTFFENFNKVIWFDDHDSSGNIRTYTLPFIDLYAKAQLLRDKKNYLANHMFGILHRDYVAERIEINETSIHKGHLVNQDLENLRVAWNLAFVNWVDFIENSTIKKHLLFKNRADYRIDFLPSNLSKRKLHISYRAAMWENIPTVGWWRTTTRNKIQEFHQKHPHYSINPPNFVNKHEYHQEMRNAVVAPSPFGIGEICYRDFECFMNGCLLLKPDMSHLETYPDLFKDGETYIAHKWDFSDFEEKLEDILAHPDRYEDIACEGQRQFHAALSDGPSFAQHFLEMIS
jgi:hypothetical protein